MTDKKVSADTNKTVASFKIEVVRLREGDYLARPAECLGNCGHAPFAWDAVIGNTEDEARREFLYRHYEQIARYIGGGA